MKTKKTNGEDGKGPSKPSRRIKTETTTKKERVASPKTAKRTGTADKGASITAQRVPTSEELHVDIAKRAYELYERRGWHQGDDLSDWLEAEQQVLNQKSLVSP